MIEDFFTPDELEPVKGALNTLVDNLAHKLYNAGKLRSMQQLAIPPMNSLFLELQTPLQIVVYLMFLELYTEYCLYQRLSKIEEEFPGANIILHKTGKLPQVMELQVYVNQNQFKVINLFPTLRK